MVMSESTKCIVLYIVLEQITKNEGHENKKKKLIQKCLKLGKNRLPGVFSKRFDCNSRTKPRIFVTLMLAYVSSFLYRVHRSTATEQSTKT